jgi:phosphopantothenoylcysteine decarboxylase/phosphopantothenate--cysteine ligase
LSNLSGLKILLGVTGGIAAYKAAELARLLRREGAAVRVVMTRAATAFVAPLTFQALSGHPVPVELLDPAAESAMGHIDLARWADLVLIAPATADAIARLRLGLADDLLSALCLAAECPLALAPAMNQAMWRHPATRDHVAGLRERGVHLWGPAEGEQACGETGPGRMLEPPDLVARVAALLRGGALSGVPVLMTAGPTREAIDPVRYISNRSSGKMGYALAEAARDQGARVSLVTGPTALPAPKVHEVVPVESADEMYRAVMARVAACRIYIGAAAVADYRPAAAGDRKIKKTRPELTLALVKTPDILSAVAASEPRPYTVGFAAETDRLEEYARRKLAGKRLDLVAANWVGRAQGGFEADDNALSVFWDGGETSFPLASKQIIAGQLIRLIAERYHAQYST